MGTAQVGLTAYLLFLNTDVVGIKLKPREHWSDYTEMFKKKVLIKKYETIFNTLPKKQHQNKTLKPY